MLLFLMKHSRPDIANATRELSKENDGANPAAFNEMLHVIRYALGTKILTLSKSQPGIQANPGK